MSHPLADRRAVGVARTGTSPEDPYDYRRVRMAVSMAMRQAGLGRRDPGAPLRDVVQPGATVLLKPNWVLHQNQSGQGMDCMVTHPAIIAAAIAEAAAAGAGRIVVGDAPIQSCHWEALVTPELQEVLRGAAGGTPVDFVDFRRTRTRGPEMGGGVVRDARPESRYALFDLGRDSLLEPLSEPPGAFRITSYDPALLARTHGPGKHQFLLCREAFEADVIVSLPKLKTHRKAGITAALKNLVGMNGNKDFLPHHRFGGSAVGGDCYPGDAPWKLAAEVYLDLANAAIGTPAYDQWAGRAFALLRQHGRHADADVEGAWHGNDTLWRTVLDLNRILIHGRADGTMDDAPQRTLWSLTDAVVCGQGEGPLAPEPLFVGAVTFSGSASAADHAHAALLGLDPGRIPSVRESRAASRWPLAAPGEAPLAALEGRLLSPRELAAHLGVRARLPRGWAGSCELEPPGPPPPGPLAASPAAGGEG
jgi:uncharacterized protein (DUF362 family)